LGEGRVPSRDYVGRGKVPVAGERGVGVGRRLVGRRRAGRRRAWRQRAGRSRWPLRSQCRLVVYSAHSVVRTSQRWSVRIRGLH
jgi:hypothetical protein